MLRVRSKVVFLAFALLAGISSAPAGATIEYTKTIDHMGVQFTNLYVHFTTAFSVSCLYGNLYLDITTDKGKAILSVLLTARAAGIQLSRVDYTMDGNGVCTIDLVEI
jgi:hypothetical protein